MDPASGEMGCEEAAMRVEDKNTDSLLAAAKATELLLESMLEDITNTHAGPSSSTTSPVSAHPPPADILMTTDPVITPDIKPPPYDDNAVAVPPAGQLGGKTVIPYCAAAPELPDDEEELPEAGPSYQAAPSAGQRGGKTIPYYYVAPEASDEEENKEIPGEDSGDEVAPTAGQFGGKTILPRPPLPQEMSDEDEHGEVIRAEGMSGIASGEKDEKKEQSNKDEDEDEDKDEDEDEDEDEEDEDEDDEDEDEAEFVKDPCEDIRDELEEVLSTDLTFKGAFAFNRTYPEAPNPTLYLEGLGHVGLPLSTRDASAIKSKAKQAPFGMGERTVIDKSVRDTWEMDATQVRFDNPAWDTFLKGVVKEVCAALGVDFAESKPRCDLYKLLLYETGSHFLPHVDTEKVDGMFATIVVVLPSHFSGDALHLSHGSLSTVYDCSPKSLLETTVLAWYTDVMHEVKPITGGHRLALSFNLIHTTTSLRPALSGQTDVVDKLRHVLLSWKQDDWGNAPQKVVYLLGHKYSLANLRGSALKGGDAQIVALLDLLAKQHGFRLGLAHVVCYVTGEADDDYGYRRGYCHYDDEDNDGYVSMAEVTHTELNIEHLVDLDGRVINDRLAFEAEDEAIPAGFDEVLQDGDYDKQEYEGYMGNYAGSLERWYRRTVLVVWPQSSNVDVMHGAQGLSYACDQIRCTVTASPTEDEHELIDYALRRASADDAALIVRSICHAARKWRHLSIWIRAVKACDADRSLSTLGEENIRKTVSTFGFEDIKAVVEDALTRDPSNSARLGFLDTLESWTSGDDNYWQRFGTQIKEWAAQHRLRVVNSLKKPQGDEYKVLISTMSRYEGLHSLENRVLPQIRSLAEPSFLLDFAIYLHESTNVTEYEIRDRIVKELISDAITKVDFYAPHVQNRPAWGYNPVSLESPAHLAQGQRYLKACLTTGQDDLMAAVIDKLTNMTGQTPQIAQNRAKEVLLPLLASLADVLRSRSPDHPLPQLRTLCDTAVDLYLKSLSANPTSVAKSDIAAMMQAMILGGQSELVVSVVVPKVEALPLNENGLRALFEELHAKKRVLSGSDVQSALDRLVKKYAKICHLQAHPSHSYYTGVAGAGHTVDILDCCLRMGVPQACSIVLDRIFTGPALLAETYFNNTLVPLVPELRKLIVKHGQLPSSDIFAPTFRRIMVGWVDKVLGSRPADTSATLVAIQKKWTCTCSHCSDIRQFLLVKPEQTRTLARIGAPARKHVEKFLQTCVGSRTARSETVRSTPQGIMVIKADSIYHPIRWLANQQKGRAILKSISNDSVELKTILGAEYSRIVNVLNGKVASSNPSIAVASGSGSGPAAGARHVPSNSYSAPAAALATSTTEPLRKRRKIDYNKDDVIDLT